ncbi:MAG: flagellar protein FlaG [Treponema sp.]|jgi:flagellar protein FlaG|nr:flagellar protein FlaG [Treponema sp.]
MGIPIAAVGNRVSLVPQQELPQDRGSIRHQQVMAQAQAAELKAAAFRKFESSLPGNRESAEEHPLELAAADIERISLAFNKKLQFVVDHQSHEVTVKVIDTETDKVIKVLPPEELQRLHNRIKETIGFLFDERV